jgi:hypothetical protein
VFSLGLKSRGWPLNTGQLSSLSFSSASPWHQLHINNVPEPLGEVGSCTIFQESLESDYSSEGGSLINAIGYLYTRTQLLQRIDAAASLQGSVIVQSFEYIIFIYNY